MISFLGSTPFDSMLFNSRSVMVFVLMLFLVLFSAMFSIPFDEPATVDLVSIAWI